MGGGIDALIARITNLENKVSSLQPHYTEIMSNAEAQRKECYNGYNSGTFIGGVLRLKSGNGNNMSEWYGGIYIPNIEKYSSLIVVLNVGGNGNSQFSGGIILYKGTNGVIDDEYNTAWREQTLYPPSPNYTKVAITKLIDVGDRVGTYVVGSLWNTYSGEDFKWNTGFGKEGSTLQVIGLPR